MSGKRTQTVSLGELQGAVDARVASGAYSSASEVMRAALRALDREEAALDEIVRQRVQAALDDPRPPIPAEEVLAHIEARHAARMKGARSDKRPLMQSRSFRRSQP